MVMQLVESWFAAVGKKVIPVLERYLDECDKRPWIAFGACQYFDLPLWDDRFPAAEEGRGGKAAPQPIPLFPSRRSLGLAPHSWTRGRS